MPKKKVSRAKKRAWTEFSKFIRARDCLATSGSIEGGNCITCGKYQPFTSLHAGHFIAGRHPSILFDERGCHAQCFRCNINLQGNTVRYFRVMQQRYGDEVIEELERRDRQLKQFKVWELEEIETKYKEKYNELKSADTRKD